MSSSRSRSVFTHAWSRWLKRVSNCVRMARHFRRAGQGHQRVGGALGGGACDLTGHDALDRFHHGGLVGA